MMPETRPATWLAASMEDLPTDRRWIDDAMAARLATMRFTKRRSETTLARWVAKAAIARTLGLPPETEVLRNVIVRNAFDGAPEASVNGRELDAVIAMTDRSDWAVCMVLRGTSRIGVDLEIVEPRSAGFIGDYFTEHEQRAVAASPDADLTANLIWSAKESALKVLRTGLRRDTRTVEVDLAQGGGSWQPLQVRSNDGHLLPGWWLRSGAFLLTCAAAKPTPPPISLIDPHGLTGASPSHGWMADPLVPPTDG